MLIFALENVIFYDKMKLYVKIFWTIIYYYSTNSYFTNHIHEVILTYIHCFALPGYVVKLINHFQKVKVFRNKYRLE